MLAADRARKFEFAHRFHRNNSTSGSNDNAFLAVTSNPARRTFSASESA